MRIQRPSRMQKIGVAVPIYGASFFGNLPHTRIDLEPFSSRDLLTQRNMRSSDEPRLTG